MLKGSQGEFLFYLQGNDYFVGSSSNSGGFASMVLGRILAGIGIGIASSVVPLYISEVIIFSVLYRHSPHLHFRIRNLNMKRYLVMFWMPLPDCTY